MVDDRLRRIIRQCVGAKNAHLLDIVVRVVKGMNVVEVYVDAEAGVTSDLCAEISREISTVLDSSRLLEGAYRLEVSSPGIERPLVFPWQYRKHIGRSMEVKIQSSQPGERRTGKLISVHETGIALEGKTSEERIEIAFSELVEARVKPPW